ncbi:hypothetical protein HU200_022283 [Digitaria exilis]|uniref:Uncharacterized protein n=1 Tax=Digitaria exilis TaxID=1010633 RepID=A0A835EYR5_9POAL|nr:hypothetical protein HU200_022283 [Digitaria exilis]
MEAGEWRRAATRAWISERRSGYWAPRREARRARRKAWSRSGSGARKWARDHRAKETRCGGCGSGTVRRRRCRTRCAAAAVDAPPLVSSTTRPKRPAARLARSVARAMAAWNGRRFGGRIARGRWNLGDWLPSISRCPPCKGGGGEALRQGGLSARGGGVERSGG